MNWRDYPEQPALREFVAVEYGGARVLVRRGYEAQLELLAGDDAPAEAEWVGGGRAAHPVVTLPGGERVLVRRYRRGGLVRHVNEARYFLGNRAFEELLATETARAAGVRAPRVVAAVQRRSGVGYGALLCSTWIDGVVDAARALDGAGAEARAALLRAVGREAGRMHRAGVAHPDLNLRNVLVRDAADGGRDSGPDSEPVVHLIDFDRATLHPGGVPRRRRARDVLRLARSARKLGSPFGVADVAALRAGYGAGWPLAEPSA